MSTFNKVDKILQAKPPYKDSQGRWRTQSMFFEKAQIAQAYQPMWTLKDIDYTHPRTGFFYPSLRRLYVELADVTEYAFAMKYFDSWPHWQRLITAPWFIPHIAQWREEVDLKLKADAMQTMQKIARDVDDKRSLQAARYLADKGWIEKKGAGRPTQEQVATELKKEVNKFTDMEDDAERIGLNTSH